MTRGIKLSSIACALIASGTALADVAYFPYPAERVGVCSWSWNTNMTTIVEEMDRMGVKCMQLSLVPWVKPLGGVEYPESLRETFGRGEPGDVFLAISNKIARGEISVLSTMISFPSDRWASYQSISNSNGIVCNADLDLDPNGETVSVTDPLGEFWWTVNSNLVDQAAAMTAALGVEYITTEIGYLDKEMISGEVNRNADCAIGFERLYQVQRICAHYGVKVLFESGQYSGAGTKAMIDGYIDRCSGCPLENGLKVEDIGVNFDIANHLIYENDDPTNAFVVLKSRIPQVHVKDSFTSLVERVAASGSAAGGFAVDVKWGTADASSVYNTLKFLKAEGFRGNALVEHEWGADRIGDIKAALKAMLLANNDDPADLWINPAVMDGDDDERCGAVLKAHGFSDRVSEKLARTGLYGSFKNWAVDHDLSPEYLSARQGVVLASAFNAPDVPAPEYLKPGISDLAIGDGLSFSLRFDGASCGFDPAACNQDLLSAAFDIEGTHSLEEGFSREGFSVESGTASEFAIPVTVRPDDGNYSFFIRAKAN